MRQVRPAELAGAEPARPADFWVESLGDHLGPDYRSAPEGERFARFGPRLLESRLREDLLEEQRWALTPQQIAEFCDQPTYDDSQAYLKKALDAERR